MYKVKDAKQCEFKLDYCVVLYIYTPNNISFIRGLKALFDQPQLHKYSPNFTVTDIPLKKGSISGMTVYQCIYLFGILRCFQHCTGHITTGSWKGRGNQYIQFVRVLYCKLPTNGKQLPDFPLEAVPGTEPRPQRWEARVLPLCHRGPDRVSTTLRFSSFSLGWRPDDNKTASFSGRPSHYVSSFTCF